MIFFPSPSSLGECFFVDVLRIISAFGAKQTICQGRADRCPEKIVLDQSRVIPNLRTGTDGAKQASRPTRRLTMKTICSTLLLVIMIAVTSPSANAQYYRNYGYYSPYGYNASYYRGYGYRSGGPYGYGAYNGYGNGAYKGYGYGNFIQRLDSEGRAGHAR
jgi:hypothetical protein